MGSRMTISDVEKAMNQHAKLDRWIAKRLKKFIKDTQKEIKKKLLSEYQHEDTL